MAQQARIEDIIIPIFDGSNYSSWKLRLLTLLEYKECHEPSITKMPIKYKDEEATWKKMDLKARTIIMSTISDKQLEYIAECTTACEMIERLDKMYLTKSTAMQIIYRAKIEEIKLSNYNTPEEFFIDFERTTNDFKAAGGKMDESEKMRYLLRALPPGYSYIGDFIDVIPEENRTVDYVKSKIKEKNMSTDEADKKTNVSTFTTKTKALCFICGKSGHLKKDCWHGQKYGQGQQNHRGRYQTSQGHRGPQRGYNRVGFHRGRGRGRDHPRSELSNTQQENSPSQSWTTQVSSLELNQVRCNENDDCDYSVINWLLDSGCTDHIINNDKFFLNYVDLKSPIDVKLPDGKMLKATKIGTVKIYFENYYSHKYINLKNVYFVESIKQNLLSFSKITKTCTIVAKNEYAKIYDQTRELIAVANKVDNLYCIKSFVSNFSDDENYFCHGNNEIYVNTTKLTDKEKWHRALGHVNFHYLSKLINNKLVEGLPDKIEGTEMKCSNCIQSKMTNLPFENNRTKTTEILELIHTDLNGPHNTTGYGGEKYFLTFIDDYSKCTRVFCIKSKAETAKCFIEFVNLVENKFNKRLKKLQCDNGKEYLNKDIYNFIRQKGIELLPCPPYVHELNGVAERYNRSIMDVGRCLMREAKIHRRYWPEIIKTAAYLKNRTIANTVENKTPYEIFFGIKPNVEHLKIYGSRVYVRVPEVLRSSKWDDKAQLGVLVGYNENGYRVLVNNKIVNARHVQVVEENTQLICLEKLDNEDDRDSNDSNDSNIKDDIIVKSESEECVDATESVSDSNNDNPNDLVVERKSKRKKSPVSRYGNPVSHFVYVNYIDANVPNTFEEATNSHDSKKWQIAMDSEMNSLMKNNTWQIVDRPKDKRVIDVKWVFKKKNDNVYKARLVVRGFQQKESLENVYSPVGKMQTLKILLSFSCENSLFIEQMDVETAFLNGVIKSEVFINQPKGYETADNKVYKLQKALYGLRESSRVWYDCFNKFIEKLGFVRSNYDHCLFVNNTNKDPVYILIFVDDLLICCKDKIKIIEVKASLMKRFAMKDLGKIKSYIGLDIDYNENRNRMTLCQTKYIESLAIKYDLEHTKLYDTPMETNLKLEQASETDDSIKYRNLIGELLYISTGTRPDIAYSVNYLSRYQSCYNRTHYKYAIRILKYLYKTKDLKLTYYKNFNSEVLDCMVDSDYAGDNVDRKSTTGFVVRLFGNLVFWKTHKQNAVTKCSTFAEYVAMSEAVTEIVFIRNLLFESFGVKFYEPIKLYEDNAGAVAIAKYGNFTKNSKHIEVQYHYINENYEKGIIDIIKIESKHNLADMLTKSLDKNKFLKNRIELGLV